MEKKKISKKKIWYLDWFVRLVVLIPMVYVSIDFVHGFFLHRGWLVLLMSLLGGGSQ